MSWKKLCASLWKHILMFALVSTRCSTMAMESIALPMPPNTAENGSQVSIVAKEYLNGAMAGFMKGLGLQVRPGERLWLSCCEQILTFWVPASIQGKRMVSEKS